MEKYQGGFLPAMIPAEEITQGRRQKALALQDVHGAVSDLFYLRRFCIVWQRTFYLMHYKIHI